LPPYYRNLGKRLVKTPKLHFYDSGLACYLLGIRSPDELRHHPLRGAVFESWVLSEMVKAHLHAGQVPDITFFRDRHGLEADAFVRQEAQHTMAHRQHVKGLVKSHPGLAETLDEVVAVCGGMYYGQEAPGMPPFVTEGMHFEKGQPLYIVEVMKMFNKVYAPFSGTIDKIIMEGGDGTIVQKGQPLFKITPDEKFVEVDQKELEREKRECTTMYLKAVL